MSRLGTPMFGMQGVHCWARVLDCHDGDTCRLGIVLPDGNACQIVVRLQGIDAPEMRSRDADERRAAVAARDRLVDWLHPGLMSGNNASIDRALMEHIVMAYVRIAKSEKYGRWLCTLHRNEDDEESVNDVLVREGHAKPYDGKISKPYALH
jgi:endonuclease YncB( thermonuclease family)